MRREDLHRGSGRKTSLSTEGKSFLLPLVFPQVLSRAHAALRGQTPCSNYGCTKLGRTPGPVKSDPGCQPVGSIGLPARQRPDGRRWDRRRYRRSSPGRLPGFLCKLTGRHTKANFLDYLAGCLASATGKAAWTALKCFVRPVGRITRTVSLRSADMASPVACHPGIGLDPITRGVYELFFWGGHKKAADSSLLGDRRCVFNSGDFVWKIATST